MGTPLAREEELCQAWRLVSSLFSLMGVCGLSDLYSLLSSESGTLLSLAVLLAELLVRVHLDQSRCEFCLVDPVC